MIGRSCFQPQQEPNFTKSQPDTKVFNKNLAPRIIPILSLLTLQENKEKTMQKRLSHFQRSFSLFLNVECLDTIHHSFDFFVSFLWHKIFKLKAGLLLTSSTMTSTERRTNSTSWIQINANVSIIWQNPSQLKK